MFEVLVRNQGTRHGSKLRVSLIKKKEHHANHHRGYRKWFMDGCPL
ncbi:protein of unknown function [Candidatus Nitrospira inopinata]|uniref:Uncharacterized protein n=1 Tax=Candidatus Nitrospira inopinata TaxID=1715989 RepID=A0A0S4KLJ2_9BACT|nr:protein of unknown function [Candidatus Nitrospira inopinata]